MHAWSFVIIKLEACNKLRLRKLRNIFRYICLSKDRSLSVITLLTRVYVTIYITALFYSSLKFLVYFCYKFYYLVLCCLYRINAFLIYSKIHQEVSVQEGKPLIMDFLKVELLQIPPPICSLFHTVLNFPAISNMIFSYLSCNKD